LGEPLLFGSLPSLFLSDNPRLFGSLAGLFPSGGPLLFVSLPRLDRSGDFAVFFVPLCHCAKNFAYIC
jgi:hypothetical protein